MKRRVATSALSVTAAGRSFSDDVQRHLCITTELAHRRDAHQAKY